MKVHFEQGCCKVVLEVDWCRVGVELLQYCWVGFMQCCSRICAVLEEARLVLSWGRVSPTLEQG